MVIKVIWCPAQGMNYSSPAKQIAHVSCKQMFMFCLFSFVKTEIKSMNENRIMRFAAVLKHILGDQREQKETILF